jgi:hypothetical protein
MNALLILTVCSLRLVNPDGSCPSAQEEHFTIAAQSPAGAVMEAFSCNLLIERECAPPMASRDEASDMQPLSYEECVQHGEAYAVQWIADHPSYKFVHYGCKIGSENGNPNEI